MKKSEELSVSCRYSTRENPPPWPLAAMGSRLQSWGAWKMAKILIVDDDTMFAMDLRHQIQRLGHKVVATAQNSHEAQLAFAQTRPDLILMDVSLAGHIDGIETAHTLLDKRKLPVIFISAASDAITVSRALQEATHAYLLKPFTSQHLNESINSALHKAGL